MNKTKTAWYHATSRQRLEHALQDGFLRAPVFVADDPDIASLFTYRLKPEESPVVLKLNLSGFRLCKDPDEYLDARVVRVDVPTVRIVEIRKII